VSLGLKRNSLGPAHSSGRPLVGDFGAAIGTVGATLVAAVRPGAAKVPLAPAVEALPGGGFGVR
jgi:hypothetical protein